MKRLSIGFVFFSLSILLMHLQTASYAQNQEIRKSLKASVMQRLGLDTDITIAYSRPGVKGRKIWGELVPYEKPWRAGANENTTIAFNKNLLVEGKELPAGSYGLHMIPSEKEWIIIFSKSDSAWGSYSYKPEEDALRITVTPQAAPHKEWLDYGFEDLAGTSATVYLHWAELKVPFKIELPAM